MPEYTVAETFEVNDAEDFILDDLVSDLMVSEEEMNIEDPLVVTEDAAADGAMAPAADIVVNEVLPGSNMPYMPEQKAEDKPTDWLNDGDHTHFLKYIKDKLSSKVPRHTGLTIPGCERALAFLKGLDNEISKAMRSDLDGKVDEAEIDAVRKEIAKGCERLDQQLKKLRSSKKGETEVRLISTGQCEQCEATTPLWHDVANARMVCLHCDAGATVADGDLKKEAGTPILNVYLTAFERAIVGTIVNSAVSAGNNIEETYTLLKNKYNFTPREELAIQQLVADYGYPVFKDRGRLNEESDPAAGDGVDWNTNYHA
jgi:hypothetical protein